MTYREWTIHEHAMYAEQNDFMEKQIRTDALLLRQLQYEEIEQYLKENNQVEYDVPPEYHICRYHVKTESKDKQLQEIYDNFFFIFRSIMAEQAPNYCNRQEIEDPTLRVSSGYLQEKANLQTGNITQCIITPNQESLLVAHKILKTSCEEKCNQIIHMDYHNPPPTESGSHQDKACVVECDIPTPKKCSNQLGTISRHNTKRPLSHSNPLTARYRHK